MIKRLLLCLFLAGCSMQPKQYYITEWVTDDVGCVYSNHKFPAKYLKAYQEYEASGRIGKIRGPY